MKFFILLIFLISFVVYIAFTEKDITVVSDVENYNIISPDDSLSSSEKYQVTENIKYKNSSNNDYIDNISTEITKKSVSNSKFVLQQKSEQTLLAQLQYDFYLEPIDEPWRVENEAKIFKIFDLGEFKNAVLNSVSCRTSTCVANISHISKQDSESFFYRFFEEMGDTSNYQIIHKTQLDNSILTTVYFKPIAAKETVVLIK